MHPTFEGIAHPAVWEVGVPAWLVLSGIAIWRQGWTGFLPAQVEPQILFVLFQPLVVFFLTSAGKTFLRRRYAQMAREEYFRRQWLTTEPGADG